MVGSSNPTRLHPTLSTVSVASKLQYLQNGKKVREQTRESLQTPSSERPIPIPIPITPDLAYIYVHRDLGFRINHCDIHF